MAARKPRHDRSVRDPQPGTAPGLICPFTWRGEEKVLYAVPGVPREMKELVTKAILPDLQERAGEPSTIFSRTLRTWGDSESGLAEKLAEDVFKTLTTHTWSSVPPGELRGLTLDYSITTFGADGTWSTEHFTDHHVPTRSGRWNLQRDVAGDWTMCRDDGRRYVVVLNADGTLVGTTTMLVAVWAAAQPDADMVAMTGAVLDQLDPIWPDWLDA